MNVDYILLLPEMRMKMKNIWIISIFSFS